MVIELIEELDYHMSCEKQLKKALDLKNKKRRPTIVQNLDLKRGITYLEMELNRIEKKEKSTSLEHSESIESKTLMRNLSNNSN